MLFTFKKQQEHLTKLVQINSAHMNSIHLEKSLLSIVALLTSVILQIFRLVNTKAHFFIIEKLDESTRKFQPKIPHSFFTISIYLLSYPVCQTLLFLTEVSSSFVFASFLTWQWTVETITSRVFSVTLGFGRGTVQDNRHTIEQTTESGYTQPSCTETASPTLTISGTPAKKQETIKPQQKNYPSDYEIPSLVDYSTPSDHVIQSSDHSSSDGEFYSVLKYT